MPFEFIQLPANGQGNAKGELNKLLRGGRIFIVAAWLVWLASSQARGVVVGLPDMDLSRQIGASYGGVGMVEIEESGGNFRGTGVLLNNRWVLTAAHNWDAGAVRNLAFFIGGQRYGAADWVQHPGWDGSFSPSQGWDVGLLRLAEPVAGFGTTRLYAGDAELAMPVTVLGAGLYGMAGGSLDSNSEGSILGITNTIDRAISLTGVHGSGGLLVYDFDNGLAAKNSLAVAAAYDAFGQPISGNGDILGSGSSALLTTVEGTTALGDSGGPAFADFGNGPELVGIVSWGVNPTEPGNLYASGYGDVGYLMRVSSLNGWITTVIPEPSSALLAIAGLVLCLCRSR